MYFWSCTLIKSFHLLRPYFHIKILDLHLLWTHMQCNEQPQLAFVPHGDAYFTVHIRKKTILQLKRYLVSLTSCPHSEVKMTNTLKQCWIMLSHMRNQHNKSNKNTCKHSRCSSVALFCFQVPSPALDLCQCHSNVSGCVIVSSWQHFAEESVQGSLFLQDWQSAAHTPSGRCLFLDDSVLIVVWVI